MRFTDKNILITGAAQGIGAAAARKFAQEGGTLILTDILADRLKEVSDSINDQKGRSFSYILDVSKKEAVDRVVKESFDRFGRIDVLVHCAGIYKKALVLEMKESEWDETLDINLKGTFLICQRLVQEMVKQKSGKIVCIASAAGEQGATIEHAHYGASKGGVIAFCKTLAREVAQYGIQVNCVAPGVILTNMTQEMIAQNRETILRNTPVGRVGTAEEVADGILFLSSKESDFITGATLDVNGGLLMR
jgi:3-oxoacyl-[acyl-carrier protein] reductase